MSQEKYIGMDVHQATISVAVMEASGKLIMECLLETKASTIVQFIQGLQGTLSLTFEEGTSAAWLRDLLKPHVSRLVVCDPRRAALLKEGNKSDRIDARKLAELLRTNQLKPVYHEEHDGSERRKFQKISFSWNSIARGAPSAFTPEPSPRRRKFPAPPCSSALVVPFGEPTPPLSMLLKGMPGPSKLEKLNTLKKEIPGRSVTLSLIL